MKNYFKILGISLAAILISCDPDSQEQFDNVNGQTAVAFAQTSIETSVPTEGKTITLPVTVTTISTESRSFNVSVSEADDANAITLGNVVIPANTYEGTIDISIDFDQIGGNDGDVRTALIQITPSEGATAYNEIATVSYFREIVCNDVILTINTDSFASETGFQILDDMRNVVYELVAGQLADGVQTVTEDIFLEDGCYTAVITDTFGDGQVDQNVTGDFTITCSIITYATGGGAFGPRQEVPFCVNQ